MKKVILILLFAFSIQSNSQDIQFRSGIFLHHSTGGCIWGPNGSPTSVPDEIASYNLENNYIGENACSLNEEGWPVDPWDNEWYRWHSIFDNEDETANILPYLAANKIIIIKSCFPSSNMWGGWGSPNDTLDYGTKSVFNYKWHWRNFISVMAQHPDNFFVIWTNAPLVMNATNEEEAYFSHHFCKWAKDTLAAGLDPLFPDFPPNVFVFDFFHKLVDNTNTLPLIYANDEWDSHPNAAATALVAPQFVEEVFDNAIQYELSFYLSAPVLQSPVNNSLEIPNIPFLTWNAVEDADSYNLQVSTINDFSNPLINQEGITNTEFQLNDLEFNAQYFWRVRAVNDIGMSFWSEVWNFTTAYETFQMNLNEGWNYVSTYYQPANPNLYELFNDILNQINIIKNGSGQIFVPEWEINQIGNWNVRSGYRINVTEQCSITLSGTRVIPEETQIPLNASWNLVPYLRCSSMATATAVQSVSANLVFIKDILGNLYYPAFGINTLSELQPGMAYWFYMNGAANLIYPEN